MVFAARADDSNLSRSCSPECARVNWKAHKPACKEAQLDKRIRDQLEATLPLFGKMQTPQERLKEQKKYEKANKIKPQIRSDGSPDLCTGCKGRLARTREQEDRDMYAMRFDSACPDCGLYLSRSTHLSPFYFHNVDIL